MKVILIYSLNLLCFKCYSEVMILCKISTGDGTSMSLYVNVITSRSLRNFAIM